jgi:hypothetical protein
VRRRHVLAGVRRWWSAGRGGFELGRFQRRNVEQRIRKQLGRIERRLLGVDEQWIRQQRIRQRIDQ